MTRKYGSSRSKPRSRQIVGFSLPPALAVEVNVEAAWRNGSVRKLFDELCALYKDKKTAGEAKHVGQSR